MKILCATVVGIKEVKACGMSKAFQLDTCKDFEIELPNPEDLLGSAKLIANKVSSEGLYGRGIILRERVFFFGYGRMSKEEQSIKDDLKMLLLPEEFCSLYNDELKERRKALLHRFGVGENGMFVDMNIPVKNFFVAYDFNGI
jgi:hypothetical protein